MNTIVTRGRLCSAKPATTKIMPSEAREWGRRGSGKSGKMWGRGEGVEGGGDNKQYLAWLFLGRKSPFPALALH